jgi:hypothetical protein
MKAINRKELSRITQRLVLPSKPEPVELDEREPMEMVADKLVEFAESVRQLSISQTKEVTKTLGLILSVLESIGKPEPVNVNLSESRPTAWDIQVTERDKTGKIKKLKLTAGE